MHFGATLRLLRIDSGLSLRALAQRIGVSSAYLSRVENGHDAVPTPDRLVAIARALGVPPMLMLELAHQVGPYVARYLDRVPAASALFLEIARRDLTAAQIARVRAFVEAECPLAALDGAPAAPPAPPRLSALLAAERIVLRLSCSDLEDAVDVAATRLARAAGAPAAATLARRILEREHDAPTAIGNGVAVPHARVAACAPMAALVTLAQPLPDATPDGVPLRLLVVLVGGDDERAHLATLAQVARLASHKLADALCEERSPDEVLAHLAQFEAVCG